MSKILARRLSAFTRVWRLERWIEKVQMCANLIDLKARYIMLQNEYLLAKACQKVDFDTTESEPSKVFSKGLTPDTCTTFQFSAPFNFSFALVNSCTISYVTIYPFYNFSRLCEKRSLSRSSQEHWKRTRPPECCAEMNPQAAAPAPAASLPLFGGAHAPAPSARSHQSMK